MSSPPTWTAQRLSGMSRTARAVAALRGHDDVVNSAVFSPDGRRILTGSEDHTARIWDAETGEQLHELRGHDTRVLAAAFSPDGERVVTASSDQTARVWDASTGEIVAVLRGHDARVSGAAFAPTGRSSSPGASTAPRGSGTRDGTEPRRLPGVHRSGQRGGVQPRRPANRHRHARRRGPRLPVHAVRQPRRSARAGACDGGADVVTHVALSASPPRAGDFRRAPAPECVNLWPRTLPH